jgi:hypothetical protein
MVLPPSQPKEVLHVAGEFAPYSMGIGKRISASLIPHGGNATFWLGYAIDKYLSMKMGGGD